MAVTTAISERIRMESTDYGKVLRLRKPSVVAFYELANTNDFREYYKKVIVPWLKEQNEKLQKKQGYDLGGPYPIEIYLIGGLLVVVTEIDNYEPWGTIPELDKYVKQVKMERLGPDLA